MKLLSSLHCTSSHENLIHSASGITFFASHSKHWILLHIQHSSVSLGLYFLLVDVELERQIGGHYSCSLNDGQVNITMRLWRTTYGRLTWRFYIPISSESLSWFRQAKNGRDVYLSPRKTWGTFVLLIRWYTIYCNINTEKNYGTLST